MSQTKEALAQMMIRQSIATGHGDTTEDLIVELERQIVALRESGNGEREENLRKECERAWGEVDAISASLKKRENDLTEALNALGQIVTMADRAIGCSPSEQDDYLAKISDLARKVALK